MYPVVRAPGLVGREEEALEAPGAGPGGIGASIRAFIQPGAVPNSRNALDSHTPHHQRWPTRTPESADRAACFPPITKSMATRAYAKYLTGKLSNPQSEAWVPGGESWPETYVIVTMSALV